MNKCFIVLVLLFVNLPAQSEDVFRIEIGKEYTKKHDQKDLQRRVWQLERAVWQLQQKVFELELSKNTQPVAPAVDTWVCTIESMGSNYTGSGSTKAVATMKAMESCKNGNRGDTFFCKNPKCEQ